MLSRRLTDIEERKAFRDYMELQRKFEVRSVDELEFFALFGYFPEAMEGGLPKRQEYTIAGVRIVITSERM
jgi:hypothetical protein